MRWLMALVNLLFVFGCSSIETSPLPPTIEGSIPLPAVQTHQDGHEILCAGGGYVGRVELHGSRSNPAVTWITFPDGDRRDVVWPEGYTARFEPNLIVFTERGLIVASEGSLASGGCPMPNGEMIGL
jgi:hypothetical protein